LHLRTLDCPTHHVEDAKRDCTMPIVFTRYKASDPRVLLSSSRGLELTPPRGFLVQLSRSVDLSGFSGRGVAGATPMVCRLLYQTSKDDEFSLSPHDHHQTTNHSETSYHTMTTIPGPSTLPLPLPPVFVLCLANLVWQLSSNGLAKSLTLTSTQPNLAPPSNSKYFR